MNLRFLSALTLLANVVWAQEWFPLEVGNQWVYRTTGTAPERKLSLEITESREVEGRRYYRLSGLAAGAYWLRSTEDAKLVALDEQQQERLWYDFAAAEGTSYETALPTCCGRATVVSRAASFDGPLGRLNNALEFTYPGVFQVGIVKEQFLPSIGLAFREENTGGPGVLRHELVYARIGGHNVFTTGEASFRLSLDQASYAAGARLAARMLFVNTTGQPVRVAFGSAQRYDVAIRDAAGRQVYRWSQGRAFAAIFGTVEFRGETHWLVSVPLGALAPGRYSIEAWITSEGAAQWKALSAFEITPVV